MRPNHCVPNERRSCAIVVIVPRSHAGNTVSGRMLPTWRAANIRLAEFNCRRSKLFAATAFGPQTPSVCRLFRTLGFTVNERKKRPATECCGADLICTFILLSNRSPQLEQPCRLRLRFPQGFRSWVRPTTCRLPACAFRFLPSSYRNIVRQLQTSCFE